MSTKESGSKEFVIFVNKKELKVSQASLTGQQILTDAGYDPSQYDLYLVRGQKSEQISLDQSVAIENGLHFNAILKNAQYG